MKKIAIVLLSIFCLLGLSGCVRMRSSLIIHSNGKVDIELLYAVMSSLAGEDEDFADELDDLEEDGWKGEVYDEDGYVGYRITKKNVDIEDVSKQMGMSEDYVSIDEKDFSLKKDGMNYVLDWKINNEEEEEAEDSSGMGDKDSYAEYLKSSGGYAEFVLVLPNKAKNSNAHQVSADGKTLTWNLMDLEAGDTIHAEFSLINIPLIIGLIVGALIVIAVVVVIIILVKKNKNNPPAQPGDGMGAPQYGDPYAQQYNQQYAQPGAQQYTQPGAQQYTQPGAQQYTQPGAQQYTQQYAQQYAQPGAQQYAQPGAQQYAQQQPQQYAQQQPQQPVTPQQPYNPGNNQPYNPQ